MRRRLVISTIAIVLVVLGALAFPVGQIVSDAAEQQLDTRLEQQATAIAEVVSTEIRGGRRPTVDTFAGFLGPDDGLQILGPDGDLIVQDIPDGVESTRVATRIVADGTRIIVLTDASPLDEDFRNKLNILLMLALGALLAAAGLAAVQAFQLARPLERLAARAGRIGDGDFSVQPFPKTHIPEIDRIGSALDSSSQRVDTLLANERHFTADATHQLRTGIAGIAMRLEILSMSGNPDVAAEATAGLDQTDQLNATIEELLAAARNRSTMERTVFDLRQLVHDHATEWQPRFTAVRRHVTVITSRPPPPVYGTKGLAGQVLDILIDNALRHGAGAVTLMLDGPSVVVIDQGAGVDPERVRTLFDGPVDPAARHGRGLPLARRLAQVDGATLDVAGNHPLRMRYELVRGDRAPDDRDSTDSVADGDRRDIGRRVENEPA
ncbi:MAG: HAMP domain-containing sensor histidine kinase [Ilumatobacter sp.]|uniref:sensor histidine kinase n=1 Tax=Ilumatobacter sp. TaxID=1967498 RepID=UPI00261D4C91|nr:HAMP domain-containing sensor histidine kinase [Ilumatobacter sp.]MDJ0768189.1 HAMP domain-containing sensor histidine kinase [Ilumatobacter sp.]